MRAPGVLCCAYFMEHIFHEAARKMNLNQLQLRTDNLIEAGFVDMFGRTEIGNRVKTNFNQIISEVDLPKQIQQVDQFNKAELKITIFRPNIKKVQSADKKSKIFGKDRAKNQ